MFLFHVNLSAYVDSPHFIISNVLLLNLKIPAIIGMPYVKVYETERERERLSVWCCVFDHVCLMNGRRFSFYLCLHDFTLFVSLICEKEISYRLNNQRETER